MSQYVYIRLPMSISTSAYASLHSSKYVYLTGSRSSIGNLVLASLVNRLGSLYFSIPSLYVSPLKLVPSLYSLLRRYQRRYTNSFYCSRGPTHRRSQRCPQGPCPEREKGDAPTEE